MFGYGGYGGGVAVTVMVVAWLWRRVRFDYSIVYLVNYRWCSYLELKKW